MKKALDLTKYRKVKNKAGYIMVVVPGRGWVGEHVLVVEHRIGRRLKKTECIHHKDFNSSNNDDSNLDLMLKVNHRLFHRRGPEAMRKRRYIRKCEIHSR